MRGHRAQNPRDAPFNLTGTQARRLLISERGEPAWDGSLWTNSNSPLALGQIGCGD
jgi:hypothetical protein